MATGIVVRMIAKLAVHKRSDPAVVVVDEKGQYVISLLSGHLGGANALAKRVAGVLGACPVITTSSEVRGKPALDLTAREAGLDIENLPLLSRVARAFLDEERIWVYDPQGCLDPYLGGEANLEWLTGEWGRGQDPDSVPLVRQGPGEGPWMDIEPYETSERHFGPEQPSLGIWVSERVAPMGLDWLILRPRNLVVGLGCNRGTAAAEILGLIRAVFADQDWSPTSIRNLATIDLKADEPGILEAAEALGRPVHFFTREAIETIVVPNPSAVVHRHIGAPSVCEAAALCSAQTQDLLIAKRKTENVTLAVARANCPS
jgi:cobalt-precorrin 5A hydrolase